MTNTSKHKDKNTLFFYLLNNIFEYGVVKNGEKKSRGTSYVGRKLKRI